MIVCSKWIYDTKSLWCKAQIVLFKRWKSCINSVCNGGKLIILHEVQFLFLGKQVVFASSCHLAVFGSCCFFESSWSWSIECFCNCRGHTFFSMVKFFGMGIHIFYRKVQENKHFSIDYLGQPMVVEKQLRVPISSVL